MSRREDLLSLGEAELVALANRGLYKRAVKDLERGDFRTEVADDGTVRLLQGEVSTVLRPGRSLLEADCSCAASGFCRHRILAVLAYRATTEEQVTEVSWSPGDFSDEELQRWVGRTVWRRAGRIRSQGLSIKLTRGTKPAAFLPTCHVVFLVPREMSYARCDCSTQGPCEHIVLACWAFRKKGDSVALAEAQQERSFDFRAGDELLGQILHLGLAAFQSSPLGPLQAQREWSQKSGFLWLADLWGEIATQLGRYQTRAAGFALDHYCELLLEWWTRTRAVEKGSAEVLLGLGESPETALDQIALTCLGVRVDRDKARTRVKVYLADPISGVVLVLPKEFSKSLSGAELSRRQVANNLPLGRLARGRMVTEAARRRANRELIIGRSGIGKTSVIEDSGDWDKRFHGPLLVKDFAALGKELEEREPTLFRSRVLADDIRILSLGRVGSKVYSPGSQTLRCQLFDPLGRECTLALTHRRGEPGALACVAESLGDSTRFVAGFAKLVRGKLELEPLSLVDSGVRSLALAVPGQGLEGLSWSGESAEGNTLGRTWGLLQKAAHDGLKFVDQSWIEDCASTARQLRREGLGRSAEQLDRLSCDRSPHSWWRVALRVWLLRTRNWS